MTNSIRKSCIVYYMYTKVRYGSQSSFFVHHQQLIIHILIIGKRKKKKKISKGIEGSAKITINRKNRFGSIKLRRKKNAHNLFNNESIEKETSARKVNLKFHQKSKYPQSILNY